MTAKMMLLGTFHFTAHNDLHNQNMNVLSSQRQAELEMLTDLLVAYRPTKICVEIERKEQAQLDLHYAQFLEAGNTQSGDEVDQLAFRLAKRMEHQIVYAVDWMETDVSTHDLGQVYTHVQVTEPDKLGLIEGFARLDADFNQSLTDIFRYYNSREVVEKHTELNLKFATIGRQEGHMGAGWLVGWLQRNLIIYANLDAIAEPEDRLLLLIGVSHVGVLESFLAQSKSFDLVNPLDYLGNSG